MISPSVQANIYNLIRRCVMSDAGVVQYCLDPSDSTKKADGTPSVLTGAHGQVMVEIPKFYTKREVQGTFTTWKLSHLPIAGYAVHPAFIKDGIEVNFRYIGAYDACYFEASTSTYKSGLNLDALTVNTATDKLASVSGVYPIVGVTRATCRTLAANRGSGWRQLDFALWSAIQMLYVVEYDSLFSQNKTGAGNTNGSYLASSSNQTDSPHTIAGASNGLGNASTNTTTGAGVSAKPGTSFMSYRGIENLYGNAWTWLDGININVGTAGTVYVNNTTSQFADGTASNYTLLTSSLPTTAGYPTNFISLDNYFLPSNATGGSTTTYLTDQSYFNGSLNRVLIAGGSALSAGNAGAFCLNAYDAGLRSRSVSARLAR